MSDHSPMITEPRLVVSKWLNDGFRGELAFGFSFRAVHEAGQPDYRLQVRGHTKNGRPALHISCAEKDIAAMVHLDQPLTLGTVTVPKPWGEEIWYTGIETRGECTASGVPLSWLIAVCPDAIMGNDDPAPLLLKILAPQAQPVYGDLYFELHTEKTEVYVVTGIDTAVWPDGEGLIRYGFNQPLLDSLGETAFKAAYLAAVKQYQQVRNQIDDELEHRRIAAGYGPDEVVPVAETEAWLASLPSELRQLELIRRADMEKYTATRTLTTGSVIQVQQRTPHSLQHGVRVVEFQSPHYERYILSFAQKVLTQNHWDTEEALQLATLSPPDPAVPQLISETHAFRLDLIADFPEFGVERLTLAAGQRFTSTRPTYQVCIGVSGSSRVCGEPVAPEQGYLIPAFVGELSVENPGTGPATLLIAFPR
ncbi:MAG: hypothetical protein KDI36_08045 [Pseudomonadales bacterium]|nr:hypothetical protein [Pseudomonadales bacterium]